MAKDITDLPYKKLKKRVKKTRKLLDALEAELEARELERQHHEVDDLEEHMDAADSSILDLTGIIKNFLTKNK
ncbi:MULTISPECIES: hypothetical protein [Kordiimonas]|jgi:hypothetical protein|uniref:Uncharacterized protein n=1 Tax=Kordiimonas lacus TaxID=637679 RepID=A0A1G7A6R2_9PROT|nr:MULTISPECIES: hypothetical protein [Kordiimonas]SDE10461.1 hypothetical protein SAMN04488071_2113 [Kordiimonas lacus]